MPKVPEAFISYSWDSEDHRQWVRSLASKLRSDGVDVTLDQWETAPGDQLPEFMESAIRKNDFIIVVCTLRYKRRSENREGGVGYEGDIMTGEALSNRNSKQFIPILREGSEERSIPSWLKGRYYLDFRNEDFEGRHYKDLIVTLHGEREKAPEIGLKPSFDRRENDQSLRSTSKKQEVAEEQSSDGFEPIEIEGVVVDKVSSPKGDGSRGSALYEIPFRLSRRPSMDWADRFIKNWNHPPRFTQMHRPGIARVVVNTVILDGTTIEEVERYHRDTLLLAVEKTNNEIEELRRKQRREAERKRQKEAKHKENVRGISDRLGFS